MKHIFFIIHILAFIIGFACISFSFLVYKRNKTTSAKHYAILLLSLTLILFEQTITTYINVNMIGNIYLEIILRLIASIGCGLTIYYSPVFVYSFFEKDMNKGTKNFFWVLASIPMVTIFLYYTFPWRFVIILVSNIALLVSILYTVINGLKYLNEAENSKKKIATTFIILSVIALPYLFLDIRIEKIPGIGSYFPYGILSFPLFYGVWNVFSMYFGFQRFGSLFYGDGKPVPELSKSIVQEKDIEVFGSKYGITAREKEVTNLLVKGYSYNKISEELVISLPTTKSHVYNIYQKAGVKSKIELLNLVKNSVEGQ